ncbi:MAG: TIGR02584 family CRISPR-associated protein [Magnetococcales bacterium]|nr:TIGR02584 family CRISPR-associated protein [Magnetococcales bacterium]
MRKTVNSKACHLVVLVGLTPQVITEALYLLMVREGRQVRRISVLTTPEGADAARNALLVGAETPLDRLCREYGLARAEIGFGLEDLHRFWRGRREDGQLESAMPDGLFESLAGWCQEGSLPVVACVAGGRKDMTVLFAQVFGLLARSEDRLVHLLVSPPFENLAEFFYPPVTPQPLAVHRAGHGVIFLDSSAAHLEMVEIPVVRLRSLLDEETRRGVIPLEHARGRVQREVESLDPKVVLHVRTCTVRHHGAEVILPPREFAVVLFFAGCRLEGLGEEGWIARRELDQEIYVTRLDGVYARIRCHHREQGWVPRERNGGVSYAEFSEKIGHSVSKIKSLLGVSHPGRVQSRRQRGGCAYGLMLDPEYIIIEEDLHNG